VLVPGRKVHLITMNYYTTLEKVFKQETEHITHKYNSVKHGEPWGLPRRTMVCHMSTRDERFTYRGRQYGIVWY